MAVAKMSVLTKVQVQSSRGLPHNSGGPGRSPSRKRSSASVGMSTSVQDPLQGGQVQSEKLRPRQKGSLCPDMCSPAHHLKVQAAS